MPEAEELLRKAVSRESHDPTILSHLGDVYAKMGKDNLAEAQWQKSLDEWHRVLPGDFEPAKLAEVRTKNIRSQAPPRAAENSGRRQAVVAYLPMKSVRVPAYAKVNLRLDVLGRRADGYHELRTIFQTISLHDTLALETKREPGIDLRIIGNPQLAGEPGPDNLVYRAIRELEPRAWYSGRVCARC